jgi:hypothetical protein
MAATVFYKGSAEIATLTNTFSVNGTATDPTTVSLAVTTPAGTATTYTYALAEITKTSTGVYTKDIACTEDGVWQYVWTGTGTASDVVAGTWTVFGTGLQTLYCTPEELKSRTGISDTLDDFEILGACHSVSRWIDEYCQRRFYRATQTRYYNPAGYYSVETDDLVSVTTLKTDTDGDGTYETTWDTSAYQLLPRNASTDSRPYTEIRAVSGTFPISCSPYARDGAVEVVGVFGWPLVPPQVKQAAAIMANDALKLGGMAFGAQGYAEYGLVRARENPIAVGLLAPFRSTPFLVA